MITTTVAKDWTPVKRGLTYCSPACGAKCTHAAYEVAVSKANALAKKCEKEIGGTWKPRVHENLGWHWSVVQDKSNLEIDKGGYLAKGNYYTIGIHGGTPVEVSLHPKTFETPKEAFDAQVALITIDANKWNDILNNIK